MCSARRDAATEIERLRAALKDMFALMDEGWFVRNTSEDHKPSFAMRQLAFVQRLRKAYEALGTPDATPTPGRPASTDWQRLPGCSDP